MTARLVAAALLAWPVAGALGQEVAVPFARTEIEGLVESSGLVVSRQHRGVLWTHNDSGGAPELFAIRLDGSLVGRIPIEGASNIDWEDLAIDDQGHLYVGDIGNNSSRRQDLSVLVIEEPDPESSEPVRPLRRWSYRFPDQPWPPDGAEANFDAEGLFWARGRLYLISKRRDDTLTVLYRFPEGDGGAELERISSFDVGGMTTAADVTPDGRYLAVLTYHSIVVFERPEEGDDYFAEPPVLQTALVVLATKQSEGLAWNGPDLLISNEQEQIHRLPDVLERRPERYP